MRSDAGVTAGFRMTLGASLLALSLGCGARASSPPATSAPAATAEPRIIFPDRFAVKVEIAADDATGSPRIAE